MTAFEQLVVMFAGDRRVCACDRAYLDPDCASSSCADNRCEAHAEEARDHVAESVLARLVGR